jgi:prevent-host-death family protein
MTVGAFEAKTHLPSLLDRVEKGEKITITRHGVPIAILAPVEKEKSKLTKAEAIEELKRFRFGRTLPEGMTIKDLIEEGRRH